MSSMLNIGSSALLAYRTSLATISNNIANANTPGYTLEATDLNEAPGQTNSSGMIGGGVDVNTIQRITNSFMQAQLTTDTSGQGRISTFQTYVSQMDSWLSNASTGLAQPIQSFFDGMNGVSANPNSSSARQTLLASAQQLSSGLAGMQQQFNALDSQVSSDLSSTVGDITGYAQQIATLNQQIMTTQAQGAGQPPNQLLDERDQAVQNLAADIGVSTTTNADGSINVYVANGQPLVLGSSANSMTVQSDQFGTSDSVMLVAQGGQTSDVTQQVTGGSLGGLLDVRREALTPAIDQIGRLAVAIGQAVNAQNEQGMDLYGNMGGAIFATPSVGVISSSNNTGSATVSATVSDPNQLGTGDYQLSFNGGTWSMIDQGSGATVALAGAGTAASPLTGGGVSIVLKSGAPTNGDQFLIQPTRNAAGELGVAITDPSLIAAADPLQTSAAVANTGNATISTAQVLDPTNPPLLSNLPATIVFTSATTYTINNVPAPPLPGLLYTSGSNIGPAGPNPPWQVQISGTPSNGDTFTVSQTGPNSSDNSNAVLMNNISNLNLLNGGGDTISSSNSALVGSVGTQAQQANAQLTAQNALVTQDQTAVSSVSGVDLDEEAAALTQFQQAYQAAAQVIATSNTLFQQLITALGTG